MEGEKRRDPGTQPTAAPVYLAFLFRFFPPSFSPRPLTFASPVVFLQR